MWFLIPALVTINVLVCLLLILVVLMQLPRSEGLGAAFGGGVTENIFGAQTTNVLAKFTVWLGIAFFIVTLLLAIAYSHRDAGKTEVQKLMETPSATAPATVAPTATPLATPATAATPEAVETAAPVETAPVTESNESAPTPVPAP